MLNATAQSWIRVRMDGALVFLRPVFASRPQEQFDEVVVQPGAEFGGRDYREWVRIAQSTGQVSIDWLMV